MRVSAARAVIVESSRGWRHAHKIDVIVALSMACLAAVQGAGKHTYTLAPFDPDFSRSRCAGSRRRSRTPFIEAREPATGIIVIDISAGLDCADTINDFSGLIEFET